LFSSKFFLAGSTVSRLIALGALISAGAVQVSFAEPTCNEGNPVQNQCFCECTSLNSSSRGEGACEIAERIKVWCAVAFMGRTGSLGPASISSTIKNTSIDLKKQNCSISPIVEKDASSLPDYRTDDYAKLVNYYSFGIIPFDQLVPRMLQLAEKGEKRPRNPGRSRGLPGGAEGIRTSDLRRRGTGRDCRTATIQS
jgi:hypothetical protein